MAFLVLMKPTQSHFASQNPKVAVLYATQTFTANCWCATGVPMSNPDELKVKKITVTVAKPRSAKYPHGRVAFGHYVVMADDTGSHELILTDAAGNPAGIETGKKFRRKLQPNESEEGVASVLTRELVNAFAENDGRVDGFGPGPVNYGPKRGWM